MLSIDGRMGEGGGQVLRTCLSLSILTGQGFNIENIRFGRAKPGLRAQHLNSVRLAKKVGNARVEGAELNSTKLIFSPTEIQSGKYQSDIGTAGSTSLVLQTIFLPLSFGSNHSILSISGGTHVPFAPSFDYLNLHWTYYLKRLGFQIALGLDKAGFYPKGCGRIRAKIKPAGILSGLQLPQRGSLKQIRGISAVSNLDRTIAQRQRNQIIRRLGHKYPLNDIRIVQMPSKFKGTSICLVCEFEHSQGCYSSLGAPGKPAEEVADEVCEKIELLLSTNATLDENIADQLLLPLSIASSESYFSTVNITDHLRTNADVIKLFLNTKIDIVGNSGSTGTVSILPENK